jgi:hypothetical protein
MKPMARKNVAGRRHARPAPAARLRAGSRQDAEVSAPCVEFADEFTADVPGGGDGTQVPDDCAGEDLPVGERPDRRPAGRTR